MASEKPSRKRAVRSIFQQGLDLFKRGIRHRDIKLGNVFIDEKEGRLFLKIRDLGRAQFYDDENFKYRVGSTTLGYFHPNDAVSLEDLLKKIKALTTMLAKAPDDKQLQLN